MENVNFDQIDANIVNGILTLTVDKISLVKKLTV